MDWDHLRFFAALVQAGSLAGAARLLQVEHTTVARRIQALEKQTGIALFAREAGGHRLTEAGRHLLPGVEAMEAAVLGVERSAPVQGGGPSGLVRVGTTEGLGTLILAPQLARLTHLLVRGCARRSLRWSNRLCAQTRTGSAAASQSGSLSFE